MEITIELLRKIEDKLWRGLEELNKDEKQLIEDGNSSCYSMCHFSDSYRYISCINLLQELKEVVYGNKTYIRYYDLEEFETEEEEAKECKTKKAISTLKKEYQNRIDELLTGECMNNIEKEYYMGVFSTAHYFEAGIDTLNKLEKRLED